MRSASQQDAFMQIDQAEKGIQSAVNMDDASLEIVEYLKPPLVPLHRHSRHNHPIKADASGR